MWYQAEFNKGKKDGIYRVYYVNGQIKDSSQYVNGKEHGKSSSTFQQVGCRKMDSKPFGLLQALESFVNLSSSGR